MRKQTLNKPLPTGEYAVGTFTYTVYNDREETMYHAIGTKRSVPVRVYYPAKNQPIFESNEVVNFTKYEPKA